MGSSGNCFSEDSELCDSETAGFRDRAFVELTKGKMVVINPVDGSYTCPFCPKKKKKPNHRHKDLLQHASGVGKSSSDKRSCKQKGEHLALAKYLMQNPPSDGFSAKLSDPSSSNDCPPKPVSVEHVPPKPLSAEELEDMIVWPWIGIVVNIPTRVGEDGRYAGESGSKLRDELIERGFNPTRVRPLWNFRGHSGTAVVEFNKSWTGLQNALSFERSYEADNRGKKEWNEANQNGEQREGLFAWVARGDDYHLPNIVGEHLRKIGDLKTISDMINEEALKQGKLFSNLTNTIEENNKHMEEYKMKVSEATNSIKSLDEENEKLYHKFYQEIKTLRMTSRDHVQRMFSGFEKLKSQMDSQKRELELRGQELEKRETVDDIERKRLAEEIRENAEKNSSLEMASLAQVKADENILKLVEDQERTKEELHKKVVTLRNEVEARQALELEIEELKGSINVMNYMDMGDDDMETIKNLEEIHKKLREKEGEYEHMDSVNQALIVKEHNSNVELQEARKEIITIFKDMSDSIGVKRLGELDSQPFVEAMKRKYSKEYEAEDRAMEICGLWEEYIKDPEWHPFIRVSVNGIDKEIIDPNNEKLNDLRKVYGDGAYKSVTTCLTEINEYNPSGRYITSELWNYDEGRRASLKEGVNVILNMWKQKKARFEME